MKKLFAIMLTFVLCFGVLSLAFAAEDEATATVPDGYTGIYSAEDLDGIRSNLSGKYILMNDIDLSAYENWNPIGTSEEPFTGELDGNGHVIKNMKIQKKCTDGDEPCFALFSSISSGEINNLMLMNIDINAKFTGETPESFGIGSISGYAKSAVFKNCITSGKITIDGFNEGVVGGISGTGVSSTLENCVNNINIKLSTENVYDICIGGIFGRATRTTINQSYNSGNISVSGTDSDQKSKNLKIGGLAADFGNFHLEVTDSYNKGNICIDFSTPSTFVGGIMGNGYLIEQCYNSGNITVPENFSGLAGGISGNFPEGWLAVVPSPDIKNAYYNNENFYPTYIGEDCAPSDDYFINVKYLTLEEMKKQESFVGFDFENIWEMEENGYPVLKNTPVIPEDEEDENSTTEITTEPTTESTTVTVTEPTTSETTTETDPSSTETTTENNKTTHPATETSTKEATIPESTTEPDDMEECWLIRIIKKIINFFMWLFSLLGC